MSSRVLYSSVKGQGRGKTRGGPEVRDRYFKLDADLTDDEKKYCRCVAHVKAKGGAYNPFAVCAKTVGTTSRECGKSFDYHGFSDDELIAYAKDSNITVPIPFDRNLLIQRLEDKRR